MIFVRSEIRIHTLTHTLVRKSWMYEFNAIVFMQIDNSSRTISYKLIGVISEFRQNIQKEKNVLHPIDI